MKALNIFSGTYTDYYQLTMSQAYFLNRKHKTKAVFDYFFRKLPFGGGYCVFAGLQDLLNILQQLKFDKEDIEFLRSKGLNADFIKYLESFSFKGNIYSSMEGDIVFPVRPVLQVETNMIEAQLIETLLLNILNFQTLVATKASRMKQAAKDCLLAEFGLRRAQSTGGYYATRAAMIGGFDVTSNVHAARDFGFELTGTMAHSFIQSYDDELSAFRSFAEAFPDDCILLVDTYDTLLSGLPNAIKVAKEMEQKGFKLKGIRLDSGDLAYLSKRVRKKLNEEGLHYVKIAVSNQLDEYVIKSLLEQKAPIDFFGVGTNLVTGQPDAALDGVYKLSLSDDKPRIKLSESLQKISIPFEKQVYRVLDEQGLFFGADAVCIKDEKEVERMHHPFEPGKSLSVKEYKKEPLLEKVMANGKSVLPEKSIAQIAAYSKERLNLLPEEYKRFQYPHEYKIGISTRLKEARDQLVDQYKK